MRITHVRIENYRVHRDTNIELDSLTAFIGRNGTGKSSVLYAIDFFYDADAVLTADDIYAGGDVEVVITVTYSDLSDAEIADFHSCVHDDHLVVIKRAVVGQPGSYFVDFPQLPEFAEVRGIARARDRRSKYNEIRESERYPDLPQVSNNDELVTAMDAFEHDSKNAEYLRPSERQVHFFDDKNTGTGRLDRYTSFVLVPAVREATEESGKRGAIQTLVDQLVAAALARREDIAAFRNEFDRRFRETYAPHNLTEIDLVSNAVNELLDRYAPGASLHLNWDEAVPPSFALPTFHTQLADSTYPTPIALQGHGTQRALVLSLLQLLAQQRAHESDEGETDSPMPDLIVAIEEPELYLHPSQCRYLARLLSELANNPARPTMQVLYATHSPYFVHMNRFEQIRAVRRPALAEGAVPCCEIGQLAFETVQEQIARVAEIEPASVTRESFVARCASVMDVVASEGFFASIAVVVEGYSDLGCFRAVEQHLELRWDERGIVIVPARSKNNIDRLVWVFQGLDIPCFFIFDGDASKRGAENAEKAARSNRLLMRLAGVEPQDFPVATVQDDWAVLEDCLETELRKPFYEAGDWDDVVNELCGDLGFRDADSMLKNPDGTAALVRRGYEMRREFPQLEAIAEQVTRTLD